MSIPNPLDAPATREALDYFAAAGFDEVDTAIMYQGGNSERSLGEGLLWHGVLCWAGKYTSIEMLDRCVLLAVRNW